MSLTGKSPSETYKDITYVDNNNNGVTTTLKQVKSGNGSSTALQVSDRSLQVKSATDNTAALDVQNASGTSKLLVDTTNNYVKANGVHVNTMYKELSTHKKLGGNMNEAYDYAHANEEQGFEGVAEAAKGLVKLRQISTPEFATGVTTKGMQLFGIDPKQTYEQAKSQYVQSGLLPADNASESDIKESFGKGSIRYDRLMKAPKDLESQLSHT